ncbi:restriction endonuclease subunit S [Acidaminococcus timonensis]|uniref:restriction endonuclease subunit S n=1 Tax=Acidaminococcus timonensis TaxID=1871002 RepID=UPI0008D9A011|nr:restriction endonuclease subunit S [Acidaminococcus timonensis]
MAGKKQSFTPEEKLARALVPQDQQPYKLPKGWVWTRLENIAELITGNTPSKKEQTYYGNDVPFYKPADLDAGRHVCTPSEYLSKNGAAVGRLIPTGATSVCCIGSIGKCGFIENPGCTNQQITSVIPYFNNLYIYYLCQSPLFQTELIEKSSSTTISIVNKAKMGKCIIPLPPLPEQQRIVARIESLFTKLDAARDKLQQVLDTQEARRAAILHKAFTGQLTGHKGSAECRGKREEERSKNPEGTEFVPEGWKKVKLTEVCAINPKKISTKGLDDSLKVSFFPMASLDERLGKITKPEIRTLSEVKKGFTNFSEADVVLAKITPCFENGKAAIIGPLMNHIGYGTTEFFVLRSTQDLYNKFLFYFIRSPKFRSEAKAHMTGAVGQQRVPKDFIENYNFMLPPLEEQCRIVDILDSLLNKEYQASTIAQSSLSQIDLLKKSILARAFRGQLGTQDPSDPDARELLTRD